MVNPGIHPIEHREKRSKLKKSSDFLWKKQCPFENLTINELSLACNWLYYFEFVESPLLEVIFTLSFAGT